VVNAIVDSVIRLAEAELPPRALGQLHRALSFPNPAFASRERMGRWTGATPEEVCLIDRDAEGRLTLPRGAVAALRAAVGGTGGSVTFEDRRVRHPRVELTFGFALRDYQEEAVRALVRHTQGTAVLPCGAGKTMVGIGTMAQLGMRTLILCTNVTALRQWKQEILEKTTLTTDEVGERGW